MVIRQGDVVWVNLPPPRGSEPAGHRPGVVIQCDAFNLSRISTIVVAAVTSQLKYESMPGNVRLSKGEAGIPKPSVVNVSQIHSIDRSYVESRLGSLSSERLRQVKEGLETVLGIR